MFLWLKCIRQWLIRMLLWLFGMLQERWAVCKFLFKLWDNITTNIAESFNGWMVKERQHMVTQLIHEHREKLAKKMYASFQAMDKWKNGVVRELKAR